MLVQSFWGALRLRGKLRDHRKFGFLSYFVTILGLAYPMGSKAQAPAIELAVVSDIHVFASSAKVPEAFHRVVADLVADPPDAVVLAGDSTSGNPSDGVSLEKAKTWWRALQSALEPLRKAGIGILPVPGNHDFYTPAHRQAYREAWAPATWFPNGKWEGEFGFRYQVFLHSSLDLLLLPIVDQSVDAETLRWIEDSARRRTLRPSEHVRWSVGHVPLASRMGKTNLSFLNTLGSALVKAGVSLHVSGHEHLTWDETLQVGAPETPLRQLWVGTASGTYQFPLRESVWLEHCKAEQGALCRMPASGGVFRVEPQTRQLRDRIVYARLKWDAAAQSQVSLRALKPSGRFGNFYEESLPSLSSDSR